MWYSTKQFWFFTIQDTFQLVYCTSRNVFHDNKISGKNINRPVILDKLVKKVSIVFDWASGCHLCNEHLSNKTRISRYWMRLSRIWRILQVKEGVIHRGSRARWITPSELCRILHILRKPNSIIALLLIQNISPFLKEFHYFLRSPK